MRERGVEAGRRRARRGRAAARLARVRRGAGDGRADGRRRRRRAPWLAAERRAGPRGGRGRPAVPRRLPRRPAARRGARRPRLRGRAPEVGLLEVELTAEGRADPLFAGLDDRLVSLQWHGDTFDLPAGAVRLASSPIDRQPGVPGRRARLRGPVPPRGDGRDGGRVGRDPGLPRVAGRDARGARRRRVHRRRRAARRTSLHPPARRLFANWLELVGRRV